MVSRYVRKLWNFLAWIAGRGGYRVQTVAAWIGIPASIAGLAIAWIEFRPASEAEKTQPPPPVIPMVRPISPATPKPRVAIAIAVSDESQKRAAGQLIGAMRHRFPGRSIIADLFVTAFYSKRHFDKVWDGDSEFLVRSGTFRQVGRAVLGRMRIDCQPKPADSELHACDLYLDFKVYDVGGRLISAGQARRVGAGFSRDRAILRGAEVLAELDGARLIALQPKVGTNR